MNESNQGRDRREWVPPLLILAAALLLRVLYLFLYAREIPFYSVPMVDAKIYEAWARLIASGDWWSTAEGVFYRAPLYPYLLAFSRVLFGASVPWVLILQTIMGLGTLWLAWRLGVRLGGRRSGLLTLLLLCLYGPLLAAESKLLTTTLGLFLHLLLLWAALRFTETRRRTWGLAAGAVLGLACLVRPQWVLLAALVPLLLMERPGRILSWWPFVLGVVLMVAPVTLRNRLVGDDWVLISSNGGMTFFQGNNDENKSGLLTVVKRFDLFGSATQQRDLERRAAEKETGREMKPSEISSFWARQGLDFIFDRPGDWVVLEARKLYRVVTSYEYADNYSYYLERERLWPLRVTFLPFGALLALGVLGAVWSRPGRGLDRLILASAALGILACLAFFVSSRYRMESVPALAILGGFALSRLSRRGEVPVRRRWTGLGLAAVIFAASFLPAGAPARSQESITYLQLGNALEAQERMREAERAYRQSIEMLPSNVFAWNNLALLLDRLDGAGEALRILSQAPDDPVLSHPVTAYAMGYLNARLDRDEEAAGWFETAVRQNPLMREAHERLALIYEKQRRYLEAESALEEALALGASNPDLWSHLGYVRIQVRKYGQAREAYEELLKLRPGDADALFNLAVCAFFLDDPAEAGERLEALGAGAEGDPLALYYRGLLAWRLSGEDPGAAGRAAEDLGRVLRSEPGNFRALYYASLAWYRAGMQGDPREWWEASWESGTGGLPAGLFEWLRERSRLKWGTGLSGEAEAGLERMGRSGEGAALARRIRSIIAEERFQPEE